MDFHPRIQKGHTQWEKKEKTKEIDEKKVMIVLNSGEIRPVSGCGREFSSHARMCIRTLWGWELAAGWRRKEKVIFKCIY